MAKIIETVEFLTQIHTSWDGTEQRMALRINPRRMVTYSYQGMESRESQYLRMLAFTQQTKIIYIPLWHAAYPLQDTVYKGQISLSVPVHTLWSYRNIGAVELWISDRVGGTRHTIKFITASGILGLNQQFKQDYAAQSIIVLPLGQGILTPDVQYANQHSEFTDTTVTVELLQNQDAPPFPPRIDTGYDEKQEKYSLFEKALPEFYMGAEIFRKEPTWGSDLGTSCKRHVNRLDNDTGIFRYDLKNKETTETKQITYTGISREEINNLQRFFYRAQGMLKSFWMPTFLADIELVESSIAGKIFLLAEFNQYWKYYANTKRRRTIVVFYKNFTAEILKIAGYSIDETGEYGKIYLDKPLSHSLYKGNILMISYLCRCRFASDTLTTEYDTTGAATIDLQIAEVDE